MSNGKTEKKTIINEGMANDPIPNLELCRQY